MKKHLSLEVIRLNMLVKKIILSITALSSAVFLNGCGDLINIFPITDTPQELHEEFVKFLDVVNTRSLSNETGSDVKINPNSILMKNNFNVYYDNTTGCFMGYVDLRKENAQDMAYQLFTGTMTSMKDIFDSAGSYTTYTIQDGEKYLQWSPYSKNIFTNFSNADAYTAKTKKPFANDTSPVNMWIDSIKKQIENGDNSVSVYLSDLNEQNGLLAQSGKDIKEILDKNPYKDFIIISYDLSFKGDISSPTINNEGDKDNYVETKNFKNYVNRKYYVLAFGDHDALTVLDNSIRERFSEIGIKSSSFIYQNAHYTETSNFALASNGLAVDSDFVQQFPPEFSILNQSGNPVDVDVPEISGAEDNVASEAEEEDFEALLGVKDEGGSESSDAILDSGLSNLEITNSLGLFTESFTGQTYILKSLNLSMSKKENQNAEFSIRLDNPDLYEMDFENASIYAYDNTSAQSKSVSLEAEENEESEVSYWSDDIATIMSYGIDVSFDNSNSTVNVKLDKLLSTVNTDSTSAIIISVPVKFTYEKNNVVRELMQINPEVQDMVNSCKVPDIINNDNKDEQFTKTYNFDSFFDKITGYRAIVNLEDNTYEVSAETSKDTETQTVDRLNIIVVADESAK